MFYTELRIIQNGRIILNGHQLNFISGMKRPFCAKSDSTTLSKLSQIQGNKEQRRYAMLSASDAMKVM